jgi:hypothetical protein
VPASVCDVSVESYSTPRIEAGMPLADDTMKCQLVPLSRESYDVAFTDEQWAALQATFPDGVCDYSEPSVGAQDAVTWLTYADTVGGRPMSDAPASVPFGQASRARAVPADTAAAAVPAAAGRRLPTTGPVSSMTPVAAAVVIAAGLVLRRRVRPASAT